RASHAKPGQNAQEGKGGVVRTLGLQGAWLGRRLLQGGVGAHLAASEVSWIEHVGAVEQGFADRFDLHPTLRVGVVRYLVGLDPDRGGGGDLRGGTRGSGAVEIDGVRATNARPGDVRSPASNSRAHLAGRTVVAANELDE